MDVAQLSHALSYQISVSASYLTGEKHAFFFLSKQPTTKVITHACLFKVDIEITPITQHSIQRFSITRREIR